MVPPLLTGVLQLLPWLNPLWFLCKSNVWLLLRVLFNNSIWHEKAVKVSNLYKRCFNKNEIEKRVEIAEHFWFFLMS